MKHRLRDKTSRARLRAVSLCAATFCLTIGSSVAEAGPLLDWLFQRNRAQSYAGAGTNSYGTYGRSDAGYARPYTSNYALNSNQQNAYRGNGYGNQGLANAPSAYGRNSNATQNFYRGQNTGLFPKRGLFGGGCSLFGNRNASRGLSSTANRTGSQFAGNQAAGPNTYGQTTGYGGANGSCPLGCQPGWCQQTVLRYMPQIAYRTDYQPVPVTTYKTTTTINPASGLPRTCTRPCTSYNWQARRVPYTTYRPVYTTVPVADNCGCNANAASNANPNVGYGSASNPNAASIAPQLPPSAGWRAVPYPSGANVPAPIQPNRIQPNRIQANRVYQPVPTQANSGWVAAGGGECTNCQNHAAGFQHGVGALTNGSNYAGTVAGDSPSNANDLPLAPRTTPWRAVGQYGDSATATGFRGDTPRPSPWRRVQRESSSRRADEDFGYRREFRQPSDQYESSNDYSDSEVPWQRVPSEATRELGNSSTTTVTGDEASERPRIDPNVHGYRGEDFFNAGAEVLVPVPERRSTRLVPVPKRVQQVPEVAPQSVEPLYHSDPRSLGGYDRVQANVGRPNYEGSYESSSAYGSATDLSDSQPLEEEMFGTPGSSESGGVFHSTDNFETRRETGYRTKAIHDNMRGGPLSQQDKTASEQAAPSGDSRDTSWTTRSDSGSSKSSRYAAVDIEWGGTVGKTNDRRWLARNEPAK